MTNLINVSDEMRKEINEHKSEIWAGYNFALTLNPDYSKEQFKATLEKSLKDLTIKTNADLRMNGHISNEINTIHYFALKEVIAEL